MNIDTLVEANEISFRRLDFCPLHYGFSPILAKMSERTTLSNPYEIFQVPARKMQRTGAMSVDWLRQRRLVATM